MYDVDRADAQVPVKVDDDQFGSRAKRLWWQRRHHPIWPRFVAALVLRLVLVFAQIDLELWDLWVGARPPAVRAATGAPLEDDAYPGSAITNRYGVPRPPCSLVKPGSPERRPQDRVDDGV